MSQRVLTALLGALFAMTASLAQAQRGGGGWGWLDKLSGPGPFDGPFFFTNFCLDGNEQDRYRCDLGKDRVWLNLGFSYLTAERDPERGFPHVAVLSFEQSVDFRVKQFRRVYFEWGLGLGVHHFKGEEFEDFWRMSFQPVRLGAVVPVGEGDTLLLQLRFTTTYFVDGFAAADFGSTGDFEARGELLPAVVGSVVLNVPKLFGK